MKYTVDAAEYGDVSLESEVGGVVLTAGGIEIVFTTEEFKEFRRAVGYVWTEVSE